MTFQRPNIEAMQGYSPGEQLPGEAIIKLNTNENPYPPAPEVGAALSAIAASDLRRYPPPMANEFSATAPVPARMRRRVCLFILVSSGKSMARCRLD